jgi:hypothetical protein
MQGKQEINPWWKEPWPWLLMSGPLLAIAACAITIWLSVTHPDQPIVEGVVQRGLVVEHAAAGASHRSTPAAR